NRPHFVTFSISWEGGPNQFWYSTLYQTSLVTWSATLKPFRQMCRIKWKTTTRKTRRPSFFFREKRNKKTLPLPPQQVGVLLSCQRLKIRKGQVVFFCKNHSKQSPPLNHRKLPFCPIFREYRIPYTASKHI